MMCIFFKNCYRYVDGIIDHAIQRTIDEVGNHIAQQAEHTHSGNPQPTELILLKGPTYEEIIVPTEVGIEEQSEGTLPFLNH